MDNIEQHGKWLSIVEYSTHKKKSISSIRRYIKAGRLKHKAINGKYFIWLKGEVRGSFVDSDREKLKREIRKLKEENQELKMLIKLYEEKESKELESNVPPQIPFH